MVNEENKSGISKVKKFVSETKSNFIDKFLDQSDDEIYENEETYETMIKDAIDYTQNYKSAMEDPVDFTKELMRCNSCGTNKPNNGIDACPNCGEDMSQVSWKEVRLGKYIADGDFEIDENYVEENGNLNVDFTADLTGEEDEDEEIEDYLTDDEDYLTEDEDDYLTEDDEDYLTGDEDYLTEDEDDYLIEDDEDYLTEDEDDYLTEDDEDYLTGDEDYLTEDEEDIEDYLTEDEDYLTDDEDDYLIEDDLEYLTGEDEEPIDVEFEENSAEENEAYSGNETVELGESYEQVNPDINESLYNKIEERLDNLEAKINKYTSKVEKEQKEKLKELDQFMYVKLLERIDELEEKIKTYESGDLGTQKTRDTLETSELENIANSRVPNTKRTSRKKIKTDMDKILGRVGNGKVLYGVKLGKRNTELDYIDACEEINEIEDFNKPLQVSLVEAVKDSYSEITGEFGDGRDRVITLEKGSIGSYAHVNDKGRKADYDSSYSIKIHTFNKDGNLLFTEQLTDGLIVVDKYKGLKKFRKPKITNFDANEELLKDKGILKRRGLLSSIKDWFSSYVPLVYSRV